MTTKPFNILITAASRRVALIRGFQNALKTLGITGRVISTDINPLSPGLYISDAYHFAPLTTDPGYMDCLVDICAREQISVLIPTIDDELAIMSDARKQLAELGVTLIISSRNTVEICNDKMQTFQFCMRDNVATPFTWHASEDHHFGAKDFPLFLKPRLGRGSVNTYRIRNRRELNFFRSYVKDAIIQEFLEGPEYTLDTFVDFDGDVISVVPRKRLWVRAGVMDKGQTEMRQELIDFGIDVAKKLGIVGPANIQVKYTGDVPKLIEVNPRFSGGIPLTIAAGADFPAWAIRMARGEKLKPRIGEFEAGLVLMSYEESVFRNIEVKDFDSLRRKLTF